MALSDHEVAITNRAVLGAGISTTLILWVSLADPVNIPKMLVLSIAAFGTLGFVVAHLLSKPRQPLHLGEWALIAFAIGILIAASTTDEKYTAIYGAAGRGNGAISYWSLSAISLCAMFGFNSKGISRLRDVLVWIGAFLALYGLLQASHSDPIKWNLLYSPVVGTLGNPDFVSAEIGICAIATLWWVLVDGRNAIRLIGAATIIVEILVIRKTNSMQGLLIIALGFTFLAVAKLWAWRKRAGQVSLALAGLGFVPVALGLINTGPFAAHIYRGSIQSRLDYWHAAISMFKAHPIVGVGLDRLGDNYWMHAPQVQQVLNQGTDNAHNVFLQLLATGGLVVFLPYIFLIGVVLITAIRAIFASDGKARFEVLALSSIWFSLLMISTISIDNLGVAVWFWISGGALYSISYGLLHKPAEGIGSKGKQTSQKSAKVLKTKGRQYPAPLISGIIVILVFLTVSPSWKSSLAIQDLVRNRSGLDKTQFTTKLISVSKAWPQNSQTLISVADLALRVNEIEVAGKLAQEAVKKDPLSYNANLLNALIFEKRLKYDLAIPYRVKMLKLNPWVTPYMMPLLKDYLAVGDRVKATGIANVISRIRPGSEDAKAAALLVKG